MNRIIRAAGFTAAAVLGAAYIYGGSGNFGNRSVTVQPKHSVTNKVAVVTGANSGIGLALTESLLNRNCRVYATYRNEECSKTLLEMAKENPQLNLVVADFDTEESLDTAIAQIKKTIGERKVDLLVNNAGYFEKRANKFGALEGPGWSKSFRVNTIAPMLVTQALAPNLDKSDDPKVVFISSRRGSIARNRDEHYEGRIAYVTSKAAANMAFSSISQTKKDWGVVMIHPGAVITNFPSVQPDRISAKESAEGIIGVIESGMKSGSFVDEKGKSIPW